MSASLNLVPFFCSWQRNTVGLICILKTHKREQVCCTMRRISSYLAEINQYLFYHTINTRQCTLVIFRPLLIEAMTGKKVRLPSFPLAYLFSWNPQRTKSACSRRPFARSTAGSRERTTSLATSLLLLISLPTARLTSWCWILCMFLFTFLREWIGFFQLDRYDFTPFPEILRWCETMKKLPYHDEAHLPLLKMLKFLKKKVNVSVTNHESKLWARRQ